MAREYLDAQFPVVNAPKPHITIPIDGREVRRMRLLARTFYEAARPRRRRFSRRKAEVGAVLHVSPSLFGADGIVGGGERAAYELARAIGGEVPTTFVSFGPRRLSWRDGDLGVEIYPSAGDLGGQRFDPLSYHFLEQVRKADVVHCSQYRVAVSQLAILAGAAMGKRTFVTDRGGVGAHFNPHVPVERCLTALLPISHFSLAHLPTRVPACVIHGGTTKLFLSTRAWAPEVTSAQSRRVLYVGRIMRHKGIDVLIEGLPEGMGLDVVGQIYDDEYVALLLRLATSRNVRFVHDATDEHLLSTYRNALVTVLPSVYRDTFGGYWEMPELLGNVLLESMACGTPAICSDVGGMPEVVEHGLTGFVVPPNDPVALGMRIDELACNPRLRYEMGRRAHERVLERFTWEHVAQRALTAYHWDDAAVD
ncbi:MAG: glycosyltransferase family 4 protein [Solirubrobacteraceae bacterium]